MATADDSKTRRVKEITAFIRSRNWSLNEFLIAFYSSEDSSISAQRGCCLAQNDGSRFAPEELIDLWFKHCPSNSQNYLEGVVIDRAGKILIRETDRACKLDSLRISTTDLKADDLDHNFALSKLESIYTVTLPYLWFLLDAIVTSWNRSEKQKKESSACKDNRARFVEFLHLFLSMQLNRLLATGLHCHHKHPAFFEESGHKRLPDNHGVVLRNFWGLKTCIGGVQPHGGFRQLQVGLGPCYLS